jgi:hypothetical protein
VPPDLADDLLSPGHEFDEFPVDAGQFAPQLIEIHDTVFYRSPGRKKSRPVTIRAGRSLDACNDQ